MEVEKGRKCEIRCVYSIRRLPCEREVAHSPIMTLAFRWFGACWLVENIPHDLSTLPTQWLYGSDCSVCMVSPV